MTPNRLDTEQNLNYRDDAIDTETDADSVRRRLQRRSARIERREVEEAISKLEAHGDPPMNSDELSACLGVISLGN